MCTIDYRYLRPKKAAFLKKWQEDPAFVQRENLTLWRGETATILPLRRVEGDGFLFGRGGVVDCDGNYVELSAIPRRVQLRYPFDAPAYRDEKVVYCGYLVKHWGHFLVEAVARLWYFLERDETVDKYVFFLNENEQREIRGNYRMFLELLGIWDKLEFINRPTTYREVIIPELGFHCRHHWSQKFLNIYNTVAENITVNPDWPVHEKLYYSRSQLAKGQDFEFGLEVLDDFYEKNGYTILYPEKVPLDEMIHYIRNSKVVATLSGSLPHNMLFASNGQQLEILERCVLNNDFQTNVNRMRQLQVAYIDANIPVYTVDMVGPFIMGYNDCMERFAEDKGYAPPKAEYTTKQYLKQCFVSYMKSYQDLYRYNWFMDDWYAEHADYLYEAYQAGHEYFGDWLDGKRPFLWHHYFELHYFKQFIKRLLKRA